MVVTDDATFALILEDVAAGVAVRKAIKTRGSNNRQFFQLLATNEEARERYGKAKQLSSDAIVEECYQIADGCKPTRDAVAKARLQIDTRKWHLCHLDPKKYGQRTVLAGDADNPLAFVDADAATVRSKLLSGAAIAATPGAAGDAHE